MGDGTESRHLLAAVELDQQITVLRNKIKTLVEERNREIYAARTQDGVWPRHIAARLANVSRDSVKAVISREQQRERDRQSGERPPDADTPTGEHLPSASAEREHDQTE